jgi:hypothetical protein
MPEHGQQGRQKGGGVPSGDASHFLTTLVSAYAAAYGSTAPFESLKNFRPNFCEPSGGRADARMDM